MTHYEKIAVFDLDGTLWDFNSHNEILNAWYKTNFFTSLLFRGISHFFRPQMFRVMCRLYERIPKDFSLSFELPFNEERLALLRQKQREEYFVLLVTNAPYEIAFHAAERLRIPFLRANAWHKKAALDESYSYEKLFVCTDNVEDIDLLKAATERHLVLTKYNRSFFEENGFYA